MRHERLIWERVAAQVARPAVSVAHKRSDSTAGPASEPMVTSRQAPASGVRPGLAAVSPLAAQALASAVTPVQVVQLVASAAEAKLAEVGIPEVAGSKMLEARMAPTAAAVPECNLLAEVRKP